MRYKAAALSFILFPTNKMNISLEIRISSCGLHKSYSSNILNPKKLSQTEQFCKTPCIDTKSIPITLCTLHIALDKNILTAISAVKKQNYEG